MAEETEQRSLLEELAEKYGGMDNVRRAAAQSFDSGARTSSARLGQAPAAQSLGNIPSIGEVNAQMEAVQMDLTSLAEEYGKLNVDFQTLIGRRKLYNTREAASIAINSALGRKNKIREIRLGAVKRKGDAIEWLVDRMAEVLQDQYQRALEGKAYSERLQVDNIAHMKYLDTELIRNLKGGSYGTSDLSQAEQEARKLGDELSDIDKVLSQYESQIEGARSKEDMDAIKKLTDEMAQVLDIKHGVLDGRLLADGVVSEIRRTILDNAEGVQASKGATAASKVNYQAISALIDSMSELEIKYRHAKDYMIPVFIMQGKIAGRGTEALKMRDLLVKMSATSQKLMQANSDLVKRLSADTFELLRTPTYDIEKARQIEADLTQYRENLNQLKMEWAKVYQRVTEEPVIGPYARPA